MKTHRQLLALLACVGLLSLGAAPAKAAESPGCGPMVDLTPGSSSLLVQGEVSEITPATEARVSPSTKVSHVRVRRVDPEGKETFGTITCTLSCTGTSCQNHGCSAWENGCTMHDCGGCEGTCTKTTTWDPPPQGGGDS